MVCFHPASVSGLVASAMVCSEGRVPVSGRVCPVAGQFVEEGAHDLYWRGGVGGRVPGPGAYGRFVGGDGPGDFLWFGFVGELPVRCERFMVGDGGVVSPVRSLSGSAC